MGAMIKKRRGLQPVREFALVVDTVVEQWIVPKGTVVKTFETENFGWAVLPAGTKDKRGFVIPRRIFRDPMQLFGK